MHLIPAWANGASKFSNGDNKFFGSRKAAASLPRAARPGPRLRDGDSSFRPCPPYFASGREGAPPSAHAPRGELPSGLGERGGGPESDAQGEGDPWVGRGAATAKQRGTRAERVFAL